MKSVYGPVILSILQAVVSWLFYQWMLNGALLGFKLKKKFNYKTKIRYIINIWPVHKFLFLSSVCRWFYFFLLLILYENKYITTTTIAVVIIVDVLFLPN